MVRASERPTPINEYVKDMTAERMDSHVRLWKLGSWEKRI
jgi:hypothetical protein